MIDRCSVEAGTCAIDLQTRGFPFQPRDANRVDIFHNRFCTRSFKKSPRIPDRTREEADTDKTGTTYNKKDGMHNLCNGRQG